MDKLTRQRILARKLTQQRILARIALADAAEDVVREFQEARRFLVPTSQGDSMAVMRHKTLYLLEKALGKYKGAYQP